MNNRGSNSLQCWICGSKASSREHLIKQSDLKMAYPAMSQASPVFHRRNGNIEKNIGSIKSNQFKYGKNICSKCNNSSTQKHDHAWSNLSNHLKDQWHFINESKVIDLTKVFPENKISSNLICVQLFFLKLFGCKAFESCAPVDFNELSRSMIDNQENRNVYLSIRASDNNFSESFCCSSDIEIFKATDVKAFYAHMFYTVGNYSVDIIYTKTPQFFNLNGALLPCQMGTRLKLATVSYSQRF